MNRSKYLLLAVIAVALIGVVACKKQKPAYEEDHSYEIYVASLSAEDTTNVLAISKDFMQTLERGQLDSAFAKLVEVNTAMQVKPLAAETVENLKNRYSKMPVKSFTMETFHMFRPDSNLVEFRYEFADAPEGQEGPTMRMATMPVKIEGKWYITLPGLYKAK